jgi:xanthine dehydrogenase accessory factor
MSEQELSKMSSPIGLDLGARTPEETAVSIAAEIIARMWGGTGQPLTTMSTTAIRWRVSRRRNTPDSQNIC